jgi:ABC-type cobalamin transport system ATPase subunit
VIRILRGMPEFTWLRLVALVAFVGTYLGLALGHLPNVPAVLLLKTIVPGFGEPTRAWLLLAMASLGLAPAIVDRVFEVVEALHRAGTAVLLVGQNVRRALTAASRAYVLAEGRIVAGGPAAQLIAEPHIRRAYLGEP